MFLLRQVSYKRGKRVILLRLTNKAQSKDSTQSTRTRLNWGPNIDPGCSYKRPLSQVTNHGRDLAIPISGPCHGRQTLASGLVALVGAWPWVATLVGSQLAGSRSLPVGTLDHKPHKDLLANASGGDDLDRSLIFRSFLP
ncbi:hypothetical protein BHM03_00057170 [Ensete ventricosum]|nr:hypothetical protein BHM03_00057170 [Ensete ventricosum]